MKPAVLLPLFLSACIAIPFPVPGKSQRPPQQIYGQWQITEINRRAVEAPDINLRIFSINPQFSARTDCNQLFGHYTARRQPQPHFPRHRRHPHGLPQHANRAAAGQNPAASAKLPHPRPPPRAARQRGQTHRARQSQHQRCRHRRTLNTSPPVNSQKGRLNIVSDGLLYD